MKKQVAVEMTLTGPAFDQFAELTRQQKEARLEATALNKKIRELKVEYDAGKKSAAQFDREMDRLTKDLAKQEIIAGNAGVQIREYRNELSGATTAGLRFRDKMSQATKDALLPFGTGMAAVTAGVALGTQAFVRFTREIFNTAIEMEAMTRKAEIVFGDALPAVTREAEKTANAMGLTTQEFINAAGGVQDLLVPLGFTREYAATLAVEVTNLSGALSLWTGGQVDASEAAQRIQKALLGETESMKELGVVVDQSSKEYNERIKVLMETEGLTKAQARSLDILKQITGQTTDAQAGFARGQGSLAQQVAEAEAQFRQAKETLATELTPAFVEVTLAATDFLNSLTGRTQEAGESAGFLSRALAVISGTQLFQLANEWDAFWGEDAPDQVEEATEKVKQMTNAVRGVGEELRGIGGRGAGQDAQVDTIGEVRQAIADLKKERDLLKIADVDGRAEIDRQIAAYQRQLDAIDGKTDAVELERIEVVKLTDAWSDYYRTQEEFMNQVSVLSTVSTNPEQSPLAPGVPLGPGSNIADNLDENLDRVENATAQYAELFLNLGTSIGQSLSQAFQDVEDANQKVLLSILETVRSAIRLYMSLTLGREIATKGFAGIATYAALLTLVEATFAAASSSIQGFAEGGYTGHGTKYEPAGVVHKGEYVIPKTGVLAAGGPEFFDQLMSLLTGVKPRNYDGMFYTGGPVTRGVAMVNMAGPGPSGPMMAQAELAAYLKTVPPPMVEVSEINRVQNRVRVVEQRSSF